MMRVPRGMSLVANRPKPLPASMTISKSGSIRVVNNGSIDQGKGIIPSVSFASVSAVGFLSCCAGAVSLLLVDVLTPGPLTLRPRISVTSSSAMVFSGVGDFDGLPWRTLCRQSSDVPSGPVQRENPKQTEVNVSKEKGKYR